MEVGNFAWWEMNWATGAVSIHRRMTDMLGYEPGQFTHYSHFTALLHPDDLEPAMQAMRDHLTGDRPEYRIEYRLKAKTGEYRWFEDVGRISSRDDAGRPITVTGVVRDINARKRAEEDVRASEKRFRGMFHGHSAVKLIIDPESGSIVDANEAAATFYGWSVRELTQMRIQQINDLPPDAVQDRMQIAVSAPNARFEFRHRRADGSTRDVEVYSNRVEIAGRPYLYSIIHDISDRKRIEEALRAAHDRLQHAIEQVKTLKGIVPICSSCKKIRDDKGYWEQVEAYVTKHTDAQFSHGICPDCLNRLYPGF